MNEGTIPVCFVEAAKGGFSPLNPPVLGDFKKLGDTPNPPAKGLCPSALPASFAIPGRRGSFMTRVATGVATLHFGTGGASFPFGKDAPQIIPGCFRLVPYDDYADYASIGDAAQIMGEAILGIFQLSLVRLTLKLFVHFVDHANPGSANRMAETL